MARQELIVLSQCEGSLNQSSLPFLPPPRCQSQCRRPLGPVPGQPTSAQSPPPRAHRGDPQAYSMVVLKRYQSSVTGLLIIFQLLPLLPGTPLSAEYSTVWSSLDSQSSREETLTTLSVSLSGNSAYILNPFHPDYKSNTHCYTTFGNYRK